MKLIVGFAVPIFLGNLFQQLYSVADAMVLGRAVGVDALAAAGSTQAVYFFVLGFITGLTHGYAILIAQRFGAGDYSGVRRTAANAAYLAAAASLLITVLSLLGSRALLEVIRRGTFLRTHCCISGSFLPGRRQQYATICSQVSCGRWGTAYRRW